MSSKNRYIQDMFDGIAERYDITNTVMSLGMNKHWRQEAARLAAIKNGGKVIDLCCGTGALSFKLAKLGQAEVVGLDYSEQMIAEADKKTSQLDATIIRFVCNDLYSNGYPDEYFDSATIAWGLRNTDDFKKTIKEMIRLVRPGGRVVMLEMGKINNRFISAIYWYLFGLFIPIVGAFLTGNKNAYKYFYESARLFLSQQEIIRMMESLKFKNIGYKNYLFGAITIIYGDK